MTGHNVHQENEVWARINETAKHDPSVNALRNHVRAIANEFSARDAFALVDGQWVLSDSAWTDWRFSGGEDKYQD